MAAIGKGGSDGQGNGEEGVGMPGQRTSESVIAADRIVEALEMAQQERKRIADATGGNVMPNPLLLGKSPSQYVLGIVKAVASSEMEQAILLLPFSSASLILDYFIEWINNGTLVEFSCRCVGLLLRLHHDQVRLIKALSLWFQHMSELRSMCYAVCWNSEHKGNSFSVTAKASQISKQLQISSGHEYGCY